MNKKLEELLYDALLPEEEPDPKLNRQIFEKRFKEASAMRQYQIKKMAAAVAVCVLAVGSITAYAAYHFLTPSQIAAEVADNHALAKAFESEDAVLVNETQTSGNYEITLLGLVSGSDLALCVDGDEAEGLKDSRTYAAVAVKRTDGMIKQEERKCVSPLLNGVEWMVANNGTMDVGLHWFEKEGVIYELLECDNLEMFAGRGVQVGVVDEFCDETEAFFLDKQTGAYKKKADYTGTNALFDLPLDKAKADEQAADAYIEKLKNPPEEELDEEEMVDDADYEKYVSDFQAAEDEAAFLKETAILKSSEVLKVDKDGMVEFGNDEGVSGTVDVSEFEQGVPTSGAITGGTLEDTEIHMFTVNADGTVTYEVYVPKVK